MRRFTVRWMLICGALLLWLVIGSTGVIGLSQEDPYEPNDTLDEATSITLPFHTEGLRISPPGDRDVFSFELEEPALVKIDVDADEIGSPLDSVLFLLDANGEEIDESDDVDGYDPRLAKSLNPGHYFVVLLGYEDSIGSYNLKIETWPIQQDSHEPNDTLGEATSITLPFQAEGLSISPQGDRDVFSFELEEPALVKIDVDADEIGSPLDSVLLLLDANGEEIDESDDVDGYDPRLAKLLNPGRYYIVIGGFEDESFGPYNLNIGIESFKKSACTEGELHQKGSQLWRLGTLPPGTKLLVTLEGPEDADFDLYLYEVISENPLLTVTVGRGTSYVSQEFIEYEVRGSEPREYLAKVRAYEGEGAYKLCWYQSIPQI